MSGSDLYITYGVSMASVALGFLLGGPWWAMGCLVFGVALITRGHLMRKEAPLHIVTGGLVRAADAVPLGEYPKVTASRYIRVPGSFSRHVLYLANEGVAAYNVQIQPIRVGGEIIEFGEIPCLAKGEELPCRIRIPSRGSLERSDLAAVLAQHSTVESFIVRVEFCIDYADFDARRYRSVCAFEYELPTFVLRLRYIRQERVAL